MNNLADSKTCGAKLRNKEAYCRNKAILMNGRCRNHGGITPKGIVSHRHITSMDALQNICRTI